MMPPMRTTLTIDDKLAAALKKRAYETGKTFKEVVNDAIRAGLESRHVLPQPIPFSLQPLSLGGAHPGIDLTKANRLAGELEDEELVLKMRQRK